MDQNSIALVFSNYGMGTAPDDLRLKLAENYLSIIEKDNQLPKFILFFAEGIKLVTEEGSISESLKALEKRGVKLIICKTCLNYYNLIDKIKVGMIGTMADICEIQFNVDKVISL